VGKKHKRSRKPEAATSKSSSLRGFLSDPFVHVIIIISLGFILYMSTSEAPFVFDDVGNILDNPAVRDMRYFTDREFLNKALTNKEIEEHFRNRIVGQLTFALNYKLHGTKVPGYHVFSVLVHLANSILVYLLVLLTMRTPWFRRVSGDTEDPYSYRMVALFAALLFVSHPIQTGAVTYVTQRFAALATMFFLLSLVLYIKWRLASEQKSSRAIEHQEGQNRYGAVSLPLYCASVFSAVLAMKTKEISFTLPLVITLYEVMFFEGKTRKRLLYLLPLLLTMLIIPFTVLGEKTAVTEIKRIGESGLGGGKENTILSYLLTQFRVIVTYLRLLVLPVNQNVDYDYPVYRSFFRPEVFLSFLFLASITAAGVYLYRRSGREGIRDRQWLRVIAFGIFWFFITISVESSIIPLLDVIFEHRLYLPSAGFFMVVVSVAAIGKNRFGKLGTQTITLFLALAVLIFSAATFQRNQIWSDDIRLWEDTVQKSPQKSRPHNNLGTVYEKKNRTNEALNEYLAALKIEPNSIDARINLGVAYGKLGLMDMAINELETALKIDPKAADAHHNLGYVYEKQGKIDKAIDEYLAALKINPKLATTHNNLGILYRKKGEIDKAINEYLTVLRLNPDLAEVHNNLGFAYEKQGQVDKAITEYLAALKIKPDIPETHHNLGMAYGKQGQADKAINEFVTALKIKPLVAAGANIEAHPANADHIYDAVNKYQEALRLNPKDTESRRHLEFLIEKMNK
jgi:tetratricopeptide (TPR) repeat protein